jgi:hypothetical protein
MFLNLTLSMIENGRQTKGLLLSVPLKPINERKLNDAEKYGGIYG